ncbi:solute carrier organic anion transporter family member 4A1 isoform X2 [Fukomys damarensis]|uniref:Solute carrier organic anion transporter family member n=2 Tax=Fukomys damarensis TaxID=885580 RepID=A0A091EP85_FUKDA|nr:solute carrier organic anion transporter family member 4A1 isoform X2 [Fukomys damarensis]XP_010636154.1 solute carrier organic anion transporter family member 4A1 isoform X2 [Fukomys damarensis]KFO37496.1 Solute carrier organic anion transporter family member 4A1 [Fukomys damarensis]
MPQHALRDKRFPLMPQLFSSASVAVENGFDRSPLGSRDSPGSERSAAHCPLDSCSRPLCQPRAERHKSQEALEAQYVSVGPRDTACGWRGFAPECLQVFNTPKGFLFFLCAASFLQGMTVNGFINTVITSIERRYDLHSYQSGLIASSYDIAACLCLTFVSYFGGSGHKPRCLGWGVLLLGAGSLVFALPHFISGRYEAEVDAGAQMGTCPANQTAVCADSRSGLSHFRLVFMLGQFLHGVGATPLYTLGVTYLDENVKSSYSPVYIAVFYTAAILGPAAGYLIGGAMLNVYTEVGRRTHLTPESPLWVGAWWIGFLGAAATALLIAVPVLGYPRQLPGSQSYVVMRTAETRQLKDHSHKTASSLAFGKTVRDLPLSIWLLLKNPTFILLCLAGATEATLVASMSTFGPKFLEAQFSLSASEAASLFGYLVVPAGGGGTLLGGFLVNRFRLRGPGIIRFCLLCTLTSLLAFFVFLTHCPNVPMAGVTVGYDSLLPEGHLNLTAACNAHCSCRPETYSPVCDTNGTMYYSPCYAGCPGLAESGPGGLKVYRGCSCVPTSLGHATAGKCTSTCQRKPLLLVLVFVVIVFTFLSSIPALTATLRCVPDRQRSFALGIQWIVVRTLGSIPGPIAFGWVIDKACLLWQDQRGHQGSCFVYQNAAMSHYMLVVGLVYKVLGFLFFAAAYFLYKSPSGPLDCLDASLPSQSSASESPTDLQRQNDV